jgi:hypothetical protein
MKDALEELRQAKITANEALCIFEEVSFIFILQTDLILDLFCVISNLNFYLLLMFYCNFVLVLKVT